MATVSLPNPADTIPAEPRPKASSPEWVKFAAGGTLLAGGILLLKGKHKAGLLAAATGTALAMIDQQETVTAWWLALPPLIDDAARMLRQVESVVQNVDAQRAKIRSLVNK